MKASVKKMIMTVGLAITLISAAVLTGGCGGSDGGSTVYLASAGPEDRIEGEFKNGITMAVEEITENDYLEGTAVEVEYFDDKRDLTTGIRIAQKLAGEKGKYTAVIGHWNASINIPAATIYNDAGLLAITPMVSSPELTIPAKEYIFRAVPTDADEAKKIAQYASDKGFENIAIVYADSDYGIGLCDEFERACGELGIQIIDSHTNFINQAEFDRQYKKWKALEIDAVFISDSLPAAVDLIDLIREKDAALPILSAGGFSFDDVIALAGENSNHVTFVSLYYPEQDLESLKDFNARYKDKFGQEPASFLASKGYECVWLIANAVKETGSTSSKDIAEYLHNMEAWKGVHNTYQYRENGDPEGMELFIVEVINGTYVYSK
jgi:branched-chain amino acid transport system substrate-binding protein